MEIKLEDLVHPKYKSPEWKIYGPYQSNNDLRRRVIAYNGTDKITVSFPKFLMECYLNRLLNEDEEVHHKDGIEFHDFIENLEVKNKTDHKRGHTSFPEYFVCPTCNTMFMLEGLKLSRMKSERKRKPDRKGPYCSRSCAGKENN